MPIYTRTGDEGTTAVFGGKRLLKSNIQIEAYGSVDELTSFLGLIISKLEDNKEKALLTSIQKSLYEIMACLAQAKVNLDYLGKEISDFEKEIDAITKKLPELRRFILPQGGELASLYHIARAICRRAERNVVGCFEKSKVKDQNSKLVLQYLNRMSDLLFTLARKNTKGREVIT